MSESEPMISKFLKFELKQTFGRVWEAYKKVLGQFMKTDELEVELEKTMHDAVIQFNKQALNGPRLHPWKYNNTMDILAIFWAKTYDASTTRNYVYDLASKHYDQVISAMEETNSFD